MWTKRNSLSWSLILVLLTTERQSSFSGGEKEKKMLISVHSTELALQDFILGFGPKSEVRGPTIDVRRVPTKRDQKICLQPIFTFLTKFESTEVFRMNQSRKLETQERLKKKFSAQVFVSFSILFFHRTSCFSREDHLARDTGSNPGLRRCASAWTRRSTTQCSRRTRPRHPSWWGWRMMSWPVGRRRWSSSQRQRRSTTCRRVEGSRLKMLILEHNEWVKYISMNILRVHWVDGIYHVL